MSYDRPVLPPCQGFQLSNELFFAALKAYLEPTVMLEQHPLPNDLASFNCVEKTTFNLAGGAGKNRYQLAFAKLIEDTRTYRTHQANDFVYRPGSFPWVQYSFLGDSTVALFSMEGKDSLQRRLHLRLLLPDMEKRYAFAYLADATGAQEYRTRILRIELMVKRGLLVDAFAKSIPKEITYPLLRWKTYHATLDSEFDVITFDAYSVYMPASIVVFRVSKYALGVDGALRHTAAAKTADGLTDLKMEKAKLWFDGFLIADEENLNFEKEESMLHIFRSFFQGKAIVPDPKRKMTPADFFDEKVNRYPLNYFPLSSYGYGENAAPYLLPKQSFSPTRFSKKADLKLQLNFKGQTFDDTEIIMYLIYHVQGVLTTAKVCFENLPV